jgi:phosphopantothenoylcysteine decarboxylase/phosphopantothenate--cysteine ligase
MLSGKKILLGVTGSIAAYKAAMIIRLLVKQHAEVQVIMTPDARNFITPLTLATLSGKPVLTQFEENESGVWNNHVALGLWADAFVIAPATANTLAAMSHGICDNLLLAVYLSARCPVFFAPAMDLDMLQHPTTRQNISRLESFGNHLITPGIGDLASGLTGPGRMAEPEDILQQLASHMGGQGRLKGKQALVTAGPTYEALDPVRFIGNHSTGKMGFAIAESLARQGAQVHLVTGPTHQQASNPNIQVHAVTSAEEMYSACNKFFDASQITVLSAAVADYRPAHRSEQKIKKQDGSITLELTKTVDIAAQLGSRKKAGQIIVGFALETEHEKANAEKKLKAKNFDLIVLNSLNHPGAGFGHDTNQVEILSRTGAAVVVPLKAKTAVAEDIVNAIIGLHA